MATPTSSVHGDRPGAAVLDLGSGTGVASRAMARRPAFADKVLGVVHPDPAQAKANDEAIIGAIVTSPRVMRGMPRFLRDAGLTLVTSFSYVLAEIGTADFSLPAIASFRRLIPAAGVMTEAAANELADALVKASDDGVFFGASNCYAYVARR